MPVGNSLGSAGNGVKQIWASGLLEIDTYDKNGIGAIRIEGDKVYKYVLNSDTAVLVVGHFVSYEGVGGYATATVHNDNAATDVGAGAAISAIGVAQFGWIQIQGEATLTTTGLTNGDPIAPAATGVVAAVAAFTEQVVGVCADQANGTYILACPL